MNTKLPSNFHLSKYGLTIRLVEECDAKFIVGLRNDPVKSLYLSVTSPNIEDQIRWIAKYKQRESQGIDYFFIFFYNDKPAGVNRLYNIEENHFVHGSWLFSNDVPPYCSLAAAVIARQIAFETLGLDIEIDTDGIHKDNIGVLQFAKFMGHLFEGSRINEQGEFLTSTLSKENFYKNLPKILKLFPKKVL